MDFNNFVERVTAEQAMFAEELKTFVISVMNRRQQLIAALLSDFDAIHDQTVTSEHFFAVVAVLTKIDSGYLKSFETVGFATSTIDSWLAKRSCPVDRMLKPTVHLLLACVLENLLVENTKAIFHSSFGGIEEVLPACLDRDELLLLPLKDIKGFHHIGGRVKNALHNLGITSLDELVALEEYELLRTPNFGRKSLNEIKGFLADSKLGFTLGCLKPEEVQRVTERRLLNYHAGAEFIGYESVDDWLIMGLTALGITERTQLATCPLSTINTLCGGNTTSKQRLVGMIRHYSYDQMGLTLGMSIPPHLKPGVKVYEEVVGG
jgi:hypothetical protein